jgi:N-acetylglucosamine kinase-like BadF-type ATPase
MREAGNDNLDKTPHVAAVCAGLAGVDTHADAALLGRLIAEVVRAERLLVLNDGEIALYGALGDAAGALVISGTGSIVWAARRDGKRMRVGGWDYLLGDEGSGYQTGLRALRAVAASHDGRLPHTRLTADVFRAFAARDFDDLLKLVYHEEMTPQRIASLAPLADCAAATGDTVAVGIIEDAAAELAQLTLSAVRLAGLNESDFPLVPQGGGLRAGGRFAERFRALIRAAEPHARIVEPLHSPAEGAVMLALRELDR